MNRRLILLSGLVVAASSWATQGGVIAMSTLQGKWTITQLSSWNFKYPPKTGRAHFIFKGAPVRAALNQTQRVLTAPEVEGDARLDEKKNLVPERIDFRGGITGHEIQGTRTIDLSADSGILRSDGVKNDLDLIGNVKLAQTDSSQGSRLDATGTKATLSGDAKSGATGILQGPVQLNLKGQSTEGAPINVHATCNAMTFDLRTAPFRVVLEGNVVVTGAQPGYDGETRANKLTLLLDKEYQPIEMQGSGDPGTTTLHRGGGKN